MIRQSDSDFNERGNNLAGVENGYNTGTGPSLGTETEPTLGHNHADT